MLKLSSIASVAVGLAACTAAPADVAAAAPAEKAETAKAERAVSEADPALFLVEDDDTKIYLFGTVHVLDEGRQWFDDAVRRAFEESDELVIEAVPLPPQEMAPLLAAGIDPEGKPLSQTISPESYARLVQELDTFGVPAEQFEPMDPWLVGVNLTGLQFQKLGMSSEAGVERTLLGAAQERGIPVGGLETIEYQLGLFDRMPEEDQVAFLEAGIEQLEDSAVFIEQMTAAWSAGDTEALAALVNDGFEDPTLREMLLTERNTNWAGWIDDRLERPGTVFVAVGAGHLGGPGSVQDALAARGIETRRVEY